MEKITIILGCIVVTVLALAIVYMFILMTMDRIFEKHINKLYLIKIDIMKLLDEPNFYYDVRKFKHESHFNNIPYSILEYVRMYKKILSKHSLLLIKYKDIDRVKKYLRNSNLKNILKTI